MLDSDLDWGQNIIRLQHRLRELGAAQVTFGDVNLDSNHLMMWPGLPNVRSLDGFRPVEGWTAVSPTMWMMRKYGLSTRDFSVQPWWALLPPGGKGGHAVALLSAAGNAASGCSWRAVGPRAITAFALSSLRGTTMKTILISAGVLIAATCLASAETKSGQSESVTIGGKTISIKYSVAGGERARRASYSARTARSARTITIRYGAPAPMRPPRFTRMPTLDLGGLTVPKGDYTLFVNLANPASWELIVNKQTGQSGLEYDAKQDLGRVKMTMSKPPALVEQLKYTLSGTGGNKGKLQLAWENVVASVNFTVK